MIAAVKQAGKSVREIRLVLCQTGAGSAGVREFIKNNYDTLRLEKQLVIRQCSQAQPSLTMRFQYGVERIVNLDKLSSTDIESRIENLAKDADRINKSL